MAAFDPVFGAEVFKVQPQRGAGAVEHGLHIGGRQLTGKGTDYDVRHSRFLPLGEPVTHLDPLLRLLRSTGLGLGTDACEGRQVIHPQAHRHALLGHQLPRKTPGHADVAVVVDDTTEDVPVRFHRDPLGKSADCPGKSSQTKAW
ncbi:hypothetical protein D3C77_243510 [compost metagenome]